MTLSENDFKLQTKYCHIQYNEENYLLAASLGANLFENYIHTKTGNRFKDGNNPLPKAISYYANSQRIYSYDQLNKLREDRNGLVHSSLSKSKYQKAIKDILNFLEQELFGETLGYFNSFERQHILEVLKFEGMLASEKPLSPQKFQVITEEDFFNLYLMRDKFLSLKEDLIKNQKLKNIGLSKASVSHVDGTSGYVWLSSFSDENNEHKVSQLSLSVLATPASIRIYIDLGGKAFDLRKKYLMLFKDKRLSEEIFSKFDMENLFVFDVEWYHSIVNQQSYDNFSTNEANIDLAINRLVEDMKTKNTVTWNKYLVGYVIPRQEISKEQINDYIVKIATLLEKIKARIAD